MRVRNPFTPAAMTIHDGGIGGWHNPVPGYWSANFRCSCGFVKYEARKTQAEVESRLRAIANKHHGQYGGSLRSTSDDEYMRRRISPEVLAEVRDLALVGGYGTEPLAPGENCALLFAATGVEIHNRAFQKVAHIAYGDVVTVGIDGPGAITTGGGFIGGGFGLTGAVEGMLFASALNALTTRTTITTYVEVQDSRAHWVFASSTQTPEQLRFNLKPVQAKLRIAAAAPTPPPTASEDLIGRLERLAALRASGALTDDEFAAAKAKLMA